MRDERGIALPTPVAALSAVAVVLAGLALVFTSGSGSAPEESARPVASSPSGAAGPAGAGAAVGDRSSGESGAAPKAKSTKSAKSPKSPKSDPKPPVQRAEVYVEVYNNSQVSGLAAATGAKADAAGWNVVGEDNWYGTIPTSTVYYPERLHRAAQLLARDLGIGRLKPAIEPMRFDRLTVILTG